MNKSLHFSFKLQWGNGNRNLDFKEKNATFTFNSIGFAQFRLLKVRELWEYLVNFFENLYFSPKNAFFGY